ncbi:MAG: hypothetical protein HQL69_10630 [Magnetococcales bacterium]|nr:hypothetical protein [Magnetococcales bacterium]
MKSHKIALGLLAGTMLAFTSACSKNTPPPAVEETAPQQYSSQPQEVRTVESRAQEHAEQAREAMAASVAADEAAEMERAEMAARQEWREGLNK